LIASFVNYRGYEKANTYAGIPEIQLKINGGSAF
jgi:hypothetical protein